jgi:hypothetical protein
VNPIVAVDRIAACLSCLDEWDRLVSDLYADEELSELVDADRIGRSVCLLDAAARLALRQLERGLVAR